jgi:FkbM family methyltransferase
MQKKLSMAGALKENIGKVAELLSMSRKCYSQVGEDLIVDCYFRGLEPEKTKGVYIDIGTHHPKKLNNTYFFYKKGWRGINIEPNTVLYNKIKRIRPRDINLNVGCAEKNGEMVFNIFHPSTLSTFDQKISEDYVKQGIALKKKKKIKIMTLKEIMEKFVSGKKIDLLTIDTEGFDLQVLNGNDWNNHNYRPKFVIVETLEYKENGEAKKLNKVFDVFFEKINYGKIADTYINTIYADREYLNKRIKE